MVERRGRGYCRRRLRMKGRMKGERGGGLCKRHTCGLKMSLFTRGRDHHPGGGPERCLRLESGVREITLWGTSRMMAAAMLHFQDGKLGRFLQGGKLVAVETREGGRGWGVRQTVESRRMTL